MNEPATDKIYKGGYHGAQPLVSVITSRRVYPLPANEPNLIRRWGSEGAVAQRLAFDLIRDMTGKAPSLLEAGEFARLALAALPLEWERSGAAWLRLLQGMDERFLVGWPKVKLEVTNEGHRYAIGTTFENGKRTVRENTSEWMAALQGVLEALRGLDQPSCVRLITDCQAVALWIEGQASPEVELLLAQASQRHRVTWVYDPKHNDLATLREWFLGL